MVTARVHVVGCGVVEPDIEAVAAGLGGGVSLSTDYLESGLHDRPDLLRLRLQDAIDGAPAGCDRIVVGYGLCGRGVVGVRARGVPLVLPRVHDCIGLFLGSDRAYREQFAACPGTYYLSAGWLAKETQPRGRRDSGGGDGGDGGSSPLPKPDIAALRSKYGEENAEAIARFVTSWQRNYRRVAFIDTGSGSAERCEARGRALAAEFGWAYERLSGDLSLLERLLTATAESRPADVLWVSPGQTIVHDPGGGLMAAANPGERSVLASGGWHGSAEVVVDAPCACRASACNGGAGTASGVRVGLGIDAGGTCTDAVVYDLEANTILATAKALTTHWDYTVGIEESVSGLPSALLADVGLVAVSTTLATNAIVEHTGQAVGLLLMPANGKCDVAALGHSPVAVIRGQLDIHGDELEPVDPDQVRSEAWRMHQQNRVGAFAVSGYASAVSSRHELAVREVLREIGFESVICGHELSDRLDFQLRANTATLNARIIPLLQSFLDDVEQALLRLRIAAPIMVVKGDGSLMSASMARTRPVETILSGPAASVAGALHLTGLLDATVVDVGGTTSDLARIAAGEVGVQPDGADVGGWRTHVRALDMRTLGLGGDSAVYIEKLSLQVGPHRIAPVSWLGSQHARTGPALAFLEERLDHCRVDTRPMQLMVLTGRSDAGIALTDRERAVIGGLAEGPCTLLELAERAGASHWRILPLERLESQGLVQRCGLTPTDLLVASGSLELWDGAVAERLLALTARAVQTTPAALSDEVRQRFTEQLALELLKRQLAATPESNGQVGDCGLCDGLIHNLFRGGDERLRVSVALNHPVVGLGAPARFFVPDAAALLGAEVVIPPHAQVANAVGAITSKVVVRRQVTIHPVTPGGFAARGFPEPLVAEELDMVTRLAQERLLGPMREAAVEAGTAAGEVAFEVADRMVKVADGSDLLLERVLTATVVGAPGVGPRHG